MLRLVFVFSALSAVAAIQAKQPDPGDLALVLNEDDWSDYLDKWLADEERKLSSINVHSSTARRNNACVYTRQQLSTSQWHHWGHSPQHRRRGPHRLPRVGFDVAGVFYPLYWSCFDQNRLEVLYVTYEQRPPSAVHQTGVTRPDWSAGSFFPGVTGGVNSRYTQVNQKITIANIIGQAQADRYITSTQFLSRGHLAAMTDFVFATGQRATFFFINCAPQWQPFNAGNWNWLEQDLRGIIGSTGHATKVFTGTFGVSQLRDANGVLQDIYLYRDTNNNPQLPVPLYYYKEVRALTFCTDRCRNNPDFNWMRWKPDDIETGYSFCCEVGDFRRTVPHLPEFNVTGLFSSVLVLGALAAAAVALPAQLPEPGDLALVLNEDDWDDYLDAWLAIEQQGFSSANVTNQASMSLAHFILCSGPASIRTAWKYCSSEHASSRCCRQLLHQSLELAHLASVNCAMPISCVLHDVYLYRDANNNEQLPVSLYFYKYTEEEVRALTFCTDRCRNNPDFDWLRCSNQKLLKMMRLVLVVAAVAVAVAALPADMPDPGELVFVLNEDDWDDYLDAWLAIEEQKWGSSNVTSNVDTRSGCTIRVNGDLGQPQPVYLRGNRYLEANGNSGQIRLNTGEQVTIACTGSGRSILHPQLSQSGRQTASATCVNNNLVSGAGWLNGNGAFGGLTCSGHSLHDALGTNNRCFNNNLIIQVGFIVNGWLYPLYVSCFDQNRLEVLYVMYEQTPANTVHQTGVDRPSWLGKMLFIFVN
ncbi:hypothetical protein MSG28_001663 [Choristoneura fumiferana]|uniref:Uncharacterized protein n=2 Tax=Choristoneura fumiferana TaxID=7141 RepID=A0ACC0KV16_CHOFU|nr:hypothetical protein MSG28_001663 [Choristoneura fumiferana]